MLSHFGASRSHVNPMSYKYQRNASCSCQDHVTIGSVQYVVADVMTFTPDISRQSALWRQHGHVLPRSSSIAPKLLITSTYQIWKQRGHVFCQSVFLAWNLAIRSLSHQVYARPFRKTIFLQLSTKNLSGRIITATHSFPLAVFVLDLE